MPTISRWIDTVLIFAVALIGAGIHDLPRTLNRDADRGQPS